MEALRCTTCGAQTSDGGAPCGACGALGPGRDEYLGQVIAGKFKVEQQIGEGGMGRVYRAHHVALDKPVVLKVLHRSMLSDSPTVARFEREAKAASRLKHPNSINIIDFGQEDDGAWYIAMDFVAGRDLQQILSSEWPLPEGRVIRMVSQVLSALAEAHSVGVIHRDLKPENIMVEQRRGQPDFVTVLDFGIAKVQDGTIEEGKALTRAGFVCGTPEYMSPEQARGSRLDARSDLYAVGVILYQLCSGLLPFESDTALGFAMKHASEQPPPPSRRNPDARISPPLERLIMRTLSKDPAERPQSAEAFREALQAVLDASGPTAAAVLQPLPLTAVAGGQRWAPETTTGETTANFGEPPLGDDKTLLNPAGALGSRSPRERLVARQGRRGALVAVAATVLIVGAAAGAFLAGAVGDGLPLSGGEGAVPLYELRISEEEQQPEEAAASSADGDRLHSRGDLEGARDAYLRSFAAAPSPALSLKLGELYFQRGELEEARRWWGRHLDDHERSVARGYIEQALDTGG